jgi:hypothetical protein
MSSPKRKHFMKKSEGHVFISYCHLDTNLRNELITSLKREDISYWCDESIEAGNKWKPQIDDALKEASAVIVVVTPDAMKSTYVTYEWSWALGSGLPVFPLLLRGSYDDVHNRLLDEHCEDCRNGIPIDILETIRGKQRTPPDIEHLNNLIGQIFTPLQVYIRIVTWLYSHLDITPRVAFDFLFKDMAEYAEEIADEILPTLMIDKSHAFTNKQKQKCRVIIDTTKTIAVLSSIHLMSVERLGETYKRAHEQEMMEWLNEYYTKTWLPNVENFDDKYRGAEALDDYLGIKHRTPEQEEEIRLEIYRMYESRLSPQEIDEMLNSEKTKESEKAIPFATIHSAYKDKEVANLVWKLINLILEEQTLE